MDQIEKRLVKEVRRYEHLYNPSLRDYKDVGMTQITWKLIADSVGLEAEECMKKWRSMRDRYVRIRKALNGSSGETGRRKVPAYYRFLYWLEPHIKHRTPLSNSVEVCFQQTFLEIGCWRCNQSGGRTADQMIHS